MGRGQTELVVFGRTLRLLDQIGPVGRFNEKSKKKIYYSTYSTYSPYRTCGGMGGGGDACISEHLPVFRAPREADGRMHQSTDEGRIHNFPDATNCMGRGQSQTQRNGRTLRLLDQIGPVGRFGEKDQAGITCIS